MKSLIGKTIADVTTVLFDRDITEVVITTTCGETHSFRATADYSGEAQILHEIVNEKD